MKTLRKTLSLTLVFALVFSLMSFAFAADATTTTTTGYKDAASITYKEAVDVTSAIGVFQGNDSNAFAPKDNLTREQAAKVITYLTMGKAAADKLTTAAAPFTDVPAGRWSAGSIAYCQQQGIVAGYGDGKFGPTDTVTGYQFAKMLLVALGYDATIEKLNGSDWSINVAKLAFANGLSAGNDAFVGSATATREEAALYALNLLTAKPVTYDTKGTNITLPDGTTVNTGASAPKQASGTFMNSCYTSLKVNSTTDDFGRAARIWTLKGVEIGTYAKAGSVIITEEQDATDLAKLLKGYSIKSGATYSVNGLTGVSIVGGSAVAGVMPADSSTFTQLAPLTGNGVKVEVFVDNDNIKLITGISVIKTDLAQVKNINTTAKTVSLAIASTGGVKTPGVTFTVKASENAALYESLKGLPLDTPVLATLNTTDNGTSYGVASVAMPQVVTGKVSATSKDGGVVVGLTLNGKAYTAAAANTGAVAGATADTKNDATILLDSFGYIVHYKGVAATATHAYVLDTYSVLSNGRVTAMAKIVLSDGTIADVAVGNTALAGTTYHVDGTTPAYTFSTETTYTQTVSAAITATQKTIGGNYFASDVKFVFINSTAKTATVKDGVQNVPAYGTGSKYILGRASASDPTLVIKAVFIVDGATAETASVVYFPSATSNGTMTVKAADGTDVSLPTYEGYINGELIKKMPVVIPTGTSVTNDFFTCIQNANGSYSIGNAAYTGAAPAAVAKTNESIASVAIGKYATLSGAVTVDLSTAVFVDLRTLVSGETKVDSLYAFNTQLVTKALNVDVLYNGADNKVAAVFVKATGAAQTITTGATPADKSVANNASATLTVTASASNGAALSYKWYSNSSASTTGATLISGATGATYSTVATATPGDVYYYCVVSATGCADATSRFAKVTTAS